MEEKKYFENVRVRVFNFGPFKKGVACYLPGIGIILGKKYADNKDLLRHEYGHYLQRKQYGLWNFFRFVALDSFKSYRNSKDKWKPWFRHYDTWTEWTANRMSWECLGRPADWNHCKNPVTINVTRDGCVVPPQLADSYKHFEASCPEVGFAFA